MKKAKILWLVLALAAVAVAADRLGFGLYHPRFPATAGGSGAPHPPLTRKQSNLMADIRAAGLRRDRSQMTKVRAALKAEHPFIVITALQALGRLGATEAVEDIHALQRRLPENSEIQPFAALALARIKAESAVPQASDRGRLQQKLERLLNVAAVSVSQIHQGASRYAAQRQAGQEHGLAPFEVQVLRQAAEIAGEAHERGVGDAFKVGGFNFSLDHAAQLKARLGQMSRQQRIQWLLNSLSQKRVLRWEEEYEMQALADEGTEASHVICEKLKLMRARHNDYHDNGFAALFRTLKCIGDPDSVPVVRLLLSDSDQWVRHDAADALRYLENNWRVVRGIDY